MPGKNRILDELRQTRPFPSRRAEGLVALVRTTDVVRRSLAAVIEPHGITLQQYNVLRILRGAGEGGIPTLEIGGRMVERSPGVTRLLDRLEAKRLVLRRRCRADRRQMLCFITPAGNELLLTLEEPLQQATDGLLAAVTDPEVEQLLSTLDAIRATEAQPVTTTIQENAL